MLQLAQKLQTLQDIAVPTSTRWSCSALSGRLSELSGVGSSAVLTTAFQLVVEAQGLGEPVAWVTAHEAVFFPPDAAVCGVDLCALAVIRVTHARACGRAAAKLARSGAFGLIILDLGRQHTIPMPLQSRLVKLAQEHRCALLCLTEKGEESASIGALVSLRAGATRLEKANSFECQLTAIKDKKRGPGWTWQMDCDGPPGLR